MLDLDDAALRATAVRGTFLVVAALQRAVVGQADRLAREYPKETGDLVKSLAVAVQAAIASEEGARRLRASKISASVDFTASADETLIEGLTPQAWLSGHREFLRQCFPDMTETERAETAERALKVRRAYADQERRGVCWQPDPEVAASLADDLKLWDQGRCGPLTPIDPDDPFADFLRDLPG